METTGSVRHFLTALSNFVDGVVRALDFEFDRVRSVSVQHSNVSRPKADRGTQRANPHTHAAQI